MILSLESETQFTRYVEFVVAHKISVGWCCCTPVLFVDLFSPFSQSLAPRMQQLSPLTLASTLLVLLAVCPFLALAQPNPCDQDLVGKVDLSLYE